MSPEDITNLESSISKLNEFEKSEVEHTKEDEDAKIEAKIKKLDQVDDESMEILEKEALSRLSKEDLHLLSGLDKSLLDKLKNIDIDLLELIDNNWDKAITIWEKLVKEESKYRFVETNDDSDKDDQDPLLFAIKELINKGITLDQMKSLKELLPHIIRALRNLKSIESDILEGRKDELFNNEDLEKLFEQEGILKAKISKLEIVGEQSKELEGFRKELRQIEI